MKIRKTVRKPVRIDRNGVVVVADVNADIAINTGDKRKSTASNRTVRVVQRGRAASEGREHGRTS